MNDPRTCAVIVTAKNTESTQLLRELFLPALMYAGFKAELHNGDRPHSSFEDALNIIESADLCFADLTDATQVDWIHLGQVIALKKKLCAVKSSASTALLMPLPTNPILYPPTLSAQGYRQIHDQIVNYCTSGVDVHEQVARVDVREQVAGVEVHEQVAGVAADASMNTSKGVTNLAKRGLSNWVLSRAMSPMENLVMKFIATTQGSTGVNRRDLGRELYKYGGAQLMSGIIKMLRQRGLIKVLDDKEWSQRFSSDVSPLNRLNLFLTEEGEKWWNTNSNDGICFVPLPEERRAFAERESVIHQLYYRLR